MTENSEWWKNDVFWKIIFRNLTVETETFIKRDVQTRIAEAEQRTLEELRCEIIATVKIDKLSTMTMGDVGHNLAVEKILKLINSKLKK